MHAVFVAAFFGGALAIALFSLLGWVGGGHVGGHAHASHAAAGHAAHGAHAGHAHVAHGDAAHAPPSAQSRPSTAARGGAVGKTLSSSLGWTLSWLSPITIAGAALWFGAAGLITEGTFGTVALLVAIVAALIGAALVRALMNAFIRSSTPPLELTGEGAIGTVNASIRADAPGEVVYTLEGLHRSMPARSAGGMPIPRGTTVVIVRREGGFAWVEPLDPLLGLQSDIETPLAGTSAREIQDQDG